MGTHNLPFSRKEAREGSLKRSDAREKETILDANKLPFSRFAGEGGAVAPDEGSIRIITLNIEHDKHYDRVIPFFKAEKPDVILIQEILEKDIIWFEKEFGMQAIFAMSCLLERVGSLPLGVATFSKFPIQKSSIAYYRGSPEPPPLIRQGEAEKQARSILVTEIEKDGIPYRLINTHFTWSPKGQATELQLEDVDKLLNLLSDIPEFVLCGDFNAPRGREIFDKIASRYQDNIPKEITTTLDKHLHKAGDLNLVVDGLFTTPHYRTHAVKVINQLSDHCAVSATIESQKSY